MLVGFLSVCKAMYGMVWYGNVMEWDGVESTGMQVGSITSDLRHHDVTGMMDTLW